MTFANQWLLLVLLIIPGIVYLLFFSKIKFNSALRYPDIGRIKKSSPSVKNTPLVVSKILRLVILTLLIFALARPQMGYHEDSQEYAVRDLFIVLDVSQSMEAMDLEPNRLQASKRIIRDFIRGRTQDRIGLVIFGLEAYLQCPLTMDYNILFESLKNIELGFINGEGTAIGDGLITAINRLKHSKAKSKVIVLLTDGDNNSGYIDPSTAAELAAAIDIRIYAIGIGKRGRVPFPGPLGTRIYNESNFDDQPLRRITSICDGKYFDAVDEESLENVFKEIDQLETTLIEQESYTWYREHFPLLIRAAFMILGALFIIDLVIFRRIP